ncbi:unnamed protein product, partial [Chrysoparadoxa australica]
PPQSLSGEPVLVREEQGEKAIECYVDTFAVLDGQNYLIGHPCDWVVSIGVPDESGGLEEVPIDSDLMDELFPIMQRNLEEDEVYLFRTPLTLTLQGEFLDDDYEDVDNASSLLTSDLTPQPSEIDDESVELIASFWHEEVEYSLVKHLAPFLLVAKPAEEGDDSYRLLSEEEARRVNPVVEELMLELG